MIPRPAWTNPPWLPVLPAQSTASNTCRTNLPPKGAVMPDHADAMVTTPQHAIVQHQGHRRRLHCDAAAVHVTDIATSLVVADGVGDHYDAQYAAQVATPTAAVAAAASGWGRAALRAERCRP